MVMAGRLCPAKEDSAGKKMVARGFGVPNLLEVAVGANLLGTGSELTKNWRPLLSSTTLAI
jgi:hypothetical protein